MNEKNPLNFVFFLLALIIIVPWGYLFVEIPFTDVVVQWWQAALCSVIGLAAFIGLKKLTGI